MSNYDGGMLITNTKISDYVRDVKTLNGKCSNVNYDKTLLPIIAKTVVSNHLFRLFTPISDTGNIYNVVTDIMNVLCVEKICINVDTIELICIMTKNEIIKILKYVYHFTDAAIDKVDLDTQINTIKNDLLFIIK